VTHRELEHVLGVDVDVITRVELIARVVTSMRNGDRLWVGNHNLHSAYLALDDAEMRRWYERADLVFVDGMSLVAASRLGRGRLRREHRATLLDWMPRVLDEAARADKVVFHLGGDPAWIEVGAAAWRRQHPGLRLLVHHGYFSPERADEVVAAINDAKPDLLLVGMGMPVQERWILEHGHQIHVPVIVAVGAFLAYASGATSRPPRWTGQLGVEWLWRLAMDPRRLGRRYLVEPFALAAALRRERARGASASFGGAQVRPVDLGGQAEDADRVTADLDDEVAGREPEQWGEEVEPSGPGDGANEEE
jgi:N-acetylglucosaminyldiphosphoundecaprenol N-acetyl-beta-D-mannosaminyltransferase